MIACSIPHAVVYLPALRAGGPGVLALHGVEVAAAYALKGYVTALGLEAGVVAAVIVNPEAEKEGGNEEAVDDRGGDEIH